MSWTWVEPFAGAAACALRAVGGPALKPPVAWMGGKRRYARAILDAMGVPDETPGQVLLADAGPWGWVWPLLLDEAGAAAVGEVLRSWAGEHPRDLWQRLAEEPPAEDPAAAAAQWLWLQARSASGVPIWWDGWRTEDPRWVSTRPQQSGGVRDAKHAMDTRPDRWSQPQGQARSTWDRWGPANEARGSWSAGDGKQASDRGEDLRWPGHRAQRGAWEQASGSGRDPQPAGQRGAWRFAARPCDAQPDRAAGPSGGSGGRYSGMVNPVTIAARIAAIAAAFSRVKVSVHHGQARELAANSGPAYVYLDPPYVGATGYGWGCPRAEVLELAQAWADAGAVVGVSEAEPLELNGWHHLELTRPGGKPEWLTLSRAPVRVAPRQQSLFPAPEVTRG